MRKFTFSFKSLLLAAGLLMGSASAWATTTVLYGRAVTADLESGYTAWSAADIGEGAWDGSTFYAAINANGLIIYNQDANHETTGTLSNASQVITNSSITAPAANSTLTYDIVWDNGSSYQHNDHYTYLSVGSGIQFRAYSQAQKGEIIIGSTTINVPNACNGGNGNRDGDVWTIHMVVSTGTNTVTALTVQGNKGTTKVNYTLDESKSIGTATYTSLALGWNRANYRPAFTTTLQSIKITEETSAATYADYTVHFVDNNSTTVKADEVRSGEVGSTVNASSDDKTTFISGGYKYVYANDGGGVEVTNDGSAEFTVTYTKYGQYTYNVYAVNSSSVKWQDDPIATATAYEDEEATLTWSKYIKIGGTWYSTAETTFRTTETEAGSRNVVYTPSNVAYFFEMESLTRSGGNYLTETSTSYSNNARLRISRGSLHYTPALAAGVYTLEIGVANSNSSASQVYVYTRSAGGVLSDVLYTHEATSGNTTINVDITVPEGYSIAFNGNEGASANNNARMDYMTLTPKPSKTISAAGWATYCSPYVLDFSSTITNLTKAYIITGYEGDALTLTQVSGKVPANTGLLFEGEGECVIPVAATSDVDVSGNILVGVTEDTNIAADAGYLLMNGEKGVGFYQNANEFTVGANTAYLPAGSVSMAKMLRIGGTATEVVAPEVAEAEEEEVLFNMAGVQVDKNFKGFVINQKGEKRFNK